MYGRTHFNLDTSLVWRKALYLDSLNINDLTLPNSTLIRHQQGLKTTSSTTPNNKNILVIFSGVHGFTGKTVVTFAMTFLKSYKNDISILTNENSMYRERY